MGERTITGWATGELGRKLSGLQLADGITTQGLAGGWVSGEVSIAERKGGAIWCALRHTCLHAFSR